MENTPFEITNTDGYYAIKNKNSVLAVLVYTTDENNLLDKIGVVTETNPHFNGGTYSGMLLGTIESSDPSLIFRAKKELMEEAGYDIEETSKWNFLGETFASKLFPEPIYCFAVDATGLKNTPPKGDGSKHEKDIKFSLLSLNAAQTIPDSILQSCIFKLFSKLYKKQIIG